jgi:hypothetical protein
MGGETTPPSPSGEGVVLCKELGEPGLDLPIEPEGLLVKGPLLLGERLLGVPEQAGL